MRQDAENLVLEINDNGRGIPEETLRHFHATGAGVGVGIAGIHERVRELGGKLTLGSDSEGTKLRVTIPFEPTAESERRT
jgi:signal transduction histidine kinase